MAAESTRLGRPPTHPATSGLKMVRARMPGRMFPRRRGSRTRQLKCPQRNSNPCLRLERPLSWSTRRWGHEGSPRARRPLCSMKPATTPVCRPRRNPTLHSSTRGSSRVSSVQVPVGIASLRAPCHRHIPTLRHDPTLGCLSHPPRLRRRRTGLNSIQTCPHLHCLAPTTLLEPRT